jgi:AAA domain
MVLQHDLAHTAAALPRMMEPGSIYEVRLLGVSASGRSPHDQSGYFDSPDAVVKALSQAPFCKAAYITLNPVKRDLFYRCMNRFQPVQPGMCTSADSVERRLLLMIDVDPRRLSGISASREEAHAARRKAIQVLRHLELFGFPRPLLVASGNGVQLHYAVDLAADDHGAIKRFLAALAAVFDDPVDCTPSAEIDTGVWEANRLCRVPGTVSRKGDHHPTRPHRVARMLYAPRRLEVVSLELLQTITEFLESGLRPTGAGQKDPINENVSVNPEESLLADLRSRGVEMAAHRAGTDGKVIPFRTCPWRPEDGQSAYIVIRKDGSVFAACHHKTCPGTNSTGNHWPELATRFHLKADYRQMVDSPETPIVVMPWRDVEHHAEDLEPSWILEGMYPERCVGVLAGPSDLGKTGFLIGLAISYVTKRPFLGLAVGGQSKSVVIYTEEDSPRDLLRQAQWMAKHLGLTTDEVEELGANIHFGKPHPSRESSLFEAWCPSLQEHLQAMRQSGVIPGLVIVETLSTVSSGDENAANTTRGLWEAAARLSESENVAVIFTHHVRKERGPNGRPLGLMARLNPGLMRGSTANEARARGVLMLTGLEPWEAKGLGLNPAVAANGGYLVLRAAKVKARTPPLQFFQRIADPEPRAWMWQPLPDQDALRAKVKERGGSPANKEVMERPSIQDQVLLVLAKANAAKTQVDLGAFGEIDRNAASKALERLRRGGMVKPRSLELTADGRKKAAELADCSAVDQVGSRWAMEEDYVLP